jgi:hypothetical protein
MLRDEKFNSTKEEAARLYRSRTNQYQELELEHNECKDFIDYVRNEEVLPFSILRVTVTKATFSPIPITDLIKALCGRGIRAVEISLVVIEKTGAPFFSNAVLTNAPDIDYPIIITNLGPSHPSKDQWEVAQYKILKLAQKNALQRLKESEIYLSAPQEVEEKKDSSFNLS